MYLHPARHNIHSAKRLLIAAVLVALAASLGNARWTTAASSSNGSAIKCTCTHCPGGALCCCHDLNCTSR